MEFGQKVNLKPVLLSLRTAILVIANITYVFDCEKPINGVCNLFFGMLMHRHVAVSSPGCVPRHNLQTYNPIRFQVDPIKDPLDSKKLL